MAGGILLGVLVCCRCGLFAELSYQKAIPVATTINDLDNPENIPNAVWQTHMKPITEV